MKRFRNRSLSGTFLFLLLNQWNRKINYNVIAYTNMSRRNSFGESILLHYCDYNANGVSAAGMKYFSTY